MMSLVSPRSWRWTHWLMFTVAAVYLASYLGLLSWADVERAIEDMARYSTVRQGFEQSPSRQHEALFVVFAFLLLTVPALLALGLVVGFVVLAVSGMFEPLTHRAGLPESLPRLAVIALLAVLVWYYHELWLPAVQWLLALVASAYLALTH